MNKKKLAMVCMTGLLLTATFPSGIRAEGASSSQLSQDKQQAEQLKGNLDDIKKQQADMLAQINQLQQQIADDLAKSSQLQKSITDTQKSLAQQKIKLSDRVRALYESGDVSYLSVLLDSTNFSDFIERFSLLTMIAEQDHNIFDQYKADEQKLLQDQTDLKAQQSERSNKQQQLLTMEKDIEAKYQDTSSKLAMTQQKISGEEMEEAQANQALQGAWQGDSSSTAPDLGNGTYIWPVPSTHVITSGYGPRWGDFHKGIDIGAPLGSKIVAVADGVVIEAGPASGFGHWVVIKHTNGLLSVYGHMYADGVLVSVGQHVKQGQVIALSGNDGESTGPHLHFSFATGISGGSLNYVNPMVYLQ